MEVPMQNTPTRNPEIMKSPHYKPAFFRVLVYPDSNVLRKVASRRRRPALAILLSKICDRLLVALNPSALVPDAPHHRMVRIRASHHHDRAARLMTNQVAGSEPRNFHGASPYRCRFPQSSTSPDQAKGRSRHADEYNWSGFSCPYCNASSFVQGGCGHLACDGTAELRNGQRFHQCFCGHAGFIIGTIKNFESNWLSAQAELGSTSLPDADRQPSTSKAADVALPPPTQGGRPATRAS
jgi:hypothetical protein